MNREGADDGSGPLRTGLAHGGTRRGGSEPGPHAGVGAGMRGGVGGDTRGAAGRAGVRAARAGRGGASADYREAVRRGDELIAEARALLARLEADDFRPNPARPPRLRVVGGTDWSGEQAGRGGKSPTT